MTQPKQSHIQKIDEKLRHIGSKIKQKTHTTKQQIAAIKPRIKAKTSKAAAKIKSVKLQINLKINLSKKKQHDELKFFDTPPKILPKGVKIVEKYPVYEPFSQVVVVQDPQTGEHRYILDELQLDSMEHGIYKRILDILLAEIQSPKEELADPRKFFAEEAKKIVEKYRISLGWLPDVSWYKILYHAERDLVGFGKIDSLMRDHDHRRNRRTQPIP